MSLSALLLVGVLTASAQGADTMTSEDCIAATENFIEVMKRDPQWKGLLQKEGQLPLMRSQAMARCAKPIEGNDLKKLQCLASANQMSDIHSCISSIAGAMSADPIPDPPTPMELPDEAAVTQEICLKVQEHIFQVMRANPKISPQERAALTEAREAFGPESDKRACKIPISPEGQVLLRCLGTITTVPAMEACVAEARQVQQVKLGPLLKTAQANTERLRGLLLAQQAAGKPLVAFGPTPTAVGQSAVEVGSLPKGPGKAMLLKLGLSAVHCTYAVHTRQYDYRTSKNDGPPIPGGFAVVTLCDLDNDGVSVHISATAQTPAKPDTPPNVF